MYIIYNYVYYIGLYILYNCNIYIYSEQDQMEHSCPQEFGRKRQPTDHDVDIWH